MGYRAGMGKTAISVDDDVLEAARASAAEANMSLSAWLTDAAQAKLRKQRAEAYGRWHAGQSDAERAESTALDQLDKGTSDISLNGAEW